MQSFKDINTKRSENDFPLPVGNKSKARECKHSHGEEEVIEQIQTLLMAQQLAQLEHATEQHLRSQQIPQQQVPAIDVVMVVALDGNSDSKGKTESSQAPEKKDPVKPPTPVTPATPTPVTPVQPTPSSSDQKIDKEPMMTIEPGSLFCPVSRQAGGNFYIKNQEKIVLPLKGNVNGTVTMNGSMVQIISGSETIDSPLSSLALTIKQGTIVEITDSAIDPMGLPKKLDVDSKLVLKPGTKVMLSAGTRFQIPGEKPIKATLDEDAYVTI